MNSALKAVVVDFVAKRGTDNAILGPVPRAVALTSEFQSLEVSPKLVITMIIVGTIACHFLACG